MGKKRLLIADRDLDVVQSISEFLREDYDVCCCHDGRQITSLVQENDIQLIITDIDLPNILIYQLLNELNTSHPEVRILIMYVYCDYTQEIENNIRRMADALFQKPFDLQKLKKKIDDLLDNNEIKDFQIK